MLTKYYQVFLLFSFLAYHKQLVFRIWKLYWQNKKI